MSTPYVKLCVSVRPKDPWTEILMAQLADFSVESFVETDTGFEAYFPENVWDTECVTLLQKENDQYSCSVEIEQLAPENWNAVWESDFDPIRIGERCAVRADFHAPIDVPYELVITPKMSFGTGHHQTTHMMLALLLEENKMPPNVLDMGCGTGVLAILAEKLGAKYLEAIDIELWCQENTQENALKNQCTRITALQGDVALLAGKQYDMILANINKNVLLNDIATYAHCLPSGGTLFLSGFYDTDLAEIKQCCSVNKLRYLGHKEKEKWTAAKFQKDEV